MKKVLFIAVHPDDETLGCGGTILKHRSMKDEIYWLILTNGGEALGWDDKKKERRKREIEKVAAMYGFVRTLSLNYPVIELDTIPMHKLISSIAEVIREIKPSVIYAPNGSDIHTDHQVSFKAVMSCTKSFRFPFISKVLVYECLSETEFAPPLPESAFIPNVFVDITKHLDKKLAIMEQYSSEIMEAPFPRSVESIEALARFRGSRIGKEYAEAFMLMEEII